MPITSYNVLHFLCSWGGGLQMVHGKICHGGKNSVEIFDLFIIIDYNHHSQINYYYNYLAMYNIVVK